MEVNNDKNVRVLAIRGRKIITTITSVISVSEKLLTVLIKGTLPEDK